MASHTNNGSARGHLATVLTIEDAILLFEPVAQQPPSTKHSTL